MVHICNPSTPTVRQEVADRRATQRPTDQPAWSMQQGRNRRDTASARLSDVYVCAVMCTLVYTHTHTIKKEAKQTLPLCNQEQNFQWGWI